ncbi:hypothetical protein AA103196_2308 [Ameyamaea chiangmaiensis NBRC 103196]|uniref:Membrane integrity-associated transporter subunit PqiC n=1 Tax=Ameyamaea chiangmaiensis TaxID=442969 RepID=A0A850P5E5_9PROT|nr:PqiC family protein [Ameyamaea chiangmaiensis]MBS4075433.1 membrane integrity-associated transporter subunit PqiC [Ameyamaea chiangmaiensis]NVN39034.1 membrane integrity-associated transporter subunit PqiC [Ameyamaea chiangmaiensis]GBQ69777.1 hypothetical protein AA103196_2308 [Ameyamaea chiangmaiensis NBRC 103196]
MAGFRHLFLAGGAACILSGLAGCNSDPTLYSLMPWPGAAAPAPVAVVEVRTPVVAQAYDRDRIVRETKDYAIKVADSDAWSDAPGQMIARTLAQDLAQRLPGTTVFAQNDATSMSPQAFVEVTMTGFSRVASGEAVLSGTMVVHAAAKGALPTVIPFRLTRQPSGRGTANLVAALSELNGALADKAALVLRTMAPAVPEAG